LRPLLHLEADRFAPTLPQEHPAFGDAEFRTRAVIAMHEAIAAYGRSGIDVIVDGSLPTEANLRDRCLAILRDVPDTSVVAVRCSVERLRERETARGDRPIGWAEESMPSIYDGVAFDLSVDTTDASPQELAPLVLRELGLNA
jgi:chloramphenicol 3-O phosphotransferase